MFLDFGSLEAVIRSFSPSLWWFCWPGMVTHWFLDAWKLHHVFYFNWTSWSSLSIQAQCI